MALTAPTDRKIGQATKPDWEEQVLPAQPEGAAQRPRKAHTADSRVKRDKRFRIIPHQAVPNSSHNRRYGNRPVLWNCFPALGRGNTLRPGAMTRRALENSNWTPFWDRMKEFQAAKRGNVNRSDVWERRSAGHLDRRGAKPEFALALTLHLIPSNPA
jgi:hypothetical protein